jgi:hypothetical protein
MLGDATPEPIPENDAAAVSLNMMWINFGRPHKSLADPHPRTSVMAAGIADRV